MSETLVTLLLGLALFGYLAWGFRTLPQERWQFLATVPRAKSADGAWHGVNLTYYGFFSANAYLAAVVVLFVLLGAIGVSPWHTAALVLATLAACVPASRLVARLVEGKRHTFSVAGAFFVALFVVPGAVLLLNVAAGAESGAPLPYLPVLAAAAIAYAFGEGLGRLACISFGCCYGKRVAELPPWAQRLFARWHFVFEGKTKKIAYASGLEGTQVLPVQALTAVLYVAAGLAGFWLFLLGQPGLVFVLTLGVTQLWRVYSEQLRADHRGGGRLSAYQWMAVAGALAAPLMVAALPHAPATGASVVSGAAVLWDPAMLLLLQAIWAAIFFYTGRSAVTEATVALRVCADKI
jgi:prolipoprotein diacylglyceryltransferase